MLIPRALNFIQSLLKILPVSGNLRLAGTSCSTISIPSSHRSPGLSNTDLVVYFTSVYDSSATFVAAAAYCETDSKGRPIAGIVFFNTAYLSADDDFNMLLKITLHEMTHLIGFSSFAYGNYIDPSTGRTYATSQVLTVTERGLAVSKLLFPKVLAAARTHLGCDSLNGVELESGKDPGSEGDSGTAGTHWEARIFLGEYMMGNRYGDMVVSHLTLSLLEDTGWYEVNHTLAEDRFTFGYKAGCSFATQKCLSGDTASNSSYICSPSSSVLYSGDIRSLVSRCNADRRSVTWCGLFDFGYTLPSPYIYFGSSSYGGFQGRFTDYCPTYQWYFPNFGLSNCSMGTSEQRTAWLSYFGDRGYTFGETSRCFESSLSASASADVMATCYGLRCSDGLATVTITDAFGATIEVECPAAGGAATVSGYSGYITCPPFSDLCPSLQPSDCPSKCSGRGDCRDSGSGPSCLCFYGYGGSDCAERSAATPTPGAAPGSVSLSIRISNDTVTFTSAVRTQFIQSVAAYFGVDTASVQIVQYSASTLAPQGQLVEVSSSGTTVVVAISSLNPETVITMAKSSSFSLSGFDATVSSSSFVPYPASPSSAAFRIANVDVPAVLGAVILTVCIFVFVM